MGYNFGVGREAPQFDLTAHDGSRVSLKQYRGDWFAVVVFLGADQAAASALVTALSAVADQLWGWRGQLVGIVARRQRGRARRRRPGRVAPSSPCSPTPTPPSLAPTAPTTPRRRRCAPTPPSSIAPARSSGRPTAAAAGVKPAALVAAMRTVAR